MRDRDALRPQWKPSPALSPRQARNLAILRGVLAILLGSAVLCVDLWQPLLDHTWALLRSSSLYRASVFETLLTLFSYGFIEAFYTSLVIDPQQPYVRLDKRSGSTHLYRNGTVLIRPYARRLYELVEYASPLLFLDLTMIKKFKGVPLDEILASGNYRPSSSTPLGLASDQLTGVKIRSTWRVPTLHNFTRSSPCQLIRALPGSAPTSREIVLCLIGALVLYDLMFFIPHILMHQVPLFWKYHKEHHRHMEMHPQITNRLSITERMLLIAAANLSLHMVGAHPLTRTLFVPFFLYILVENHSGVELPYGYHRILPQGWVSGPACHAEHHRHGTGGYQPYLRWADALWERFGWDGTKTA